MRGPSLVVQGTVVSTEPQVKGGASTSELNSSRSCVTRGLDWQIRYLALSVLIIFCVQQYLIFTILPIPPADGVGEVCGEVGGVLPGGVPAPAAEHAAHSEAPGADPLANTPLVCKMPSSSTVLCNTLNLSTPSLSSKSHSAQCWHCRGCW